MFLVLAVFPMVQLAPSTSHGTDSALLFRLIQQDLIHMGKDNDNTGTGTLDLKPRCIIASYRHTFDADRQKR